MVTLQPTRPTITSACLAPCTRQCGTPFGLVVDAVPSLRLRLPMHSAAPAIDRASPDSAALGRLVAGPRASASLPHVPAGSGAMSARRAGIRTVRCPTGTTLRADRWDPPHCRS
jgi:hypothetical protein